MAIVKLKIPDVDLKKARIRARKEGTSVHDLIRKWFHQYSGKDEDIRATMDLVLDAAEKHKGRLSGPRPLRDEIYVRNPKRGW